MKPLTRLPKLLISAFVCFLLVAVSIYPVAAESNGFMEGFDDPVLDPAWQIVEFTGTRVYGNTSPANHYSLTENPGHLRYRLDPMTHYDGFAYDFQTSSSLHSSADHDPGLELRRIFSGDEWLLEAKVNYYFPYTTKRGFALDVYFGDGDVGTFSVQFLRERDTYGNTLRILLAEKTGGNPWDDTLAAVLNRYIYSSSAPKTSTFYFKLERSGGILTAMWSEDDLVWNDAFSQDMGTLLDGLEQTLVITGLSRENPGGSYADYDFVNVISNVIPDTIAEVIPTSLNVNVDIKPGSDSNVIPLKSNGVIPVAILGDEEFDATAIELLSVTFGVDEALEAHGKGHFEDVNGDGYDDMLLHFRTQETGIVNGDTEACLEGETIDGFYFIGCDGIRTSNK